MQLITHWNLTIQPMITDMQLNLDPTESAFMNVSYLHQHDIIQNQWLNESIYMFKRKGRPYLSSLNLIHQEEYDGWSVRGSLRIFFLPCDARTNNKLLSFRSPTTSCCEWMFYAHTLALPSISFPVAEFGLLAFSTLLKSAHPKTIEWQFNCLFDWHICKSRFWCSGSDSELC